MVDKNILHQQQQHTSLSATFRLTRCTEHLPRNHWSWFSHTKFQHLRQTAGRYDGQKWRDASL